MKITASRLDDVRRQREEWDAKYAPLKNKYEEDTKTWRKARYEAFDAVTKAIKDAIGPTSLELDIDTQEYYGEGMEVRIRANERKKFETGSSLSWNWETKVDDNGNVKFDSGSWSGLKATTKEQLDDLKESVRIFEILQNLDWVSLVQIDKGVLDYQNYIDKDNMDAMYEMDRNKPNFKQIESEAAVADLIGSNTAVKVSGLPDDHYYGGYYNGYILILGESPSTYRVAFLSNYDLERLNRGLETIESLKKYSTNKKKANVLRTIDVDDTLDLIDAE